MSVEEVHNVIRERGFEPLGEKIASVDARTLASQVNSIGGKHV